MNNLAVTWAAVSGATGYKVQWKSGTETWSTNTRHAVDVTPRGRERRVQVVYEARSGRAASVTVGGYLRSNPEHDAAAESEFGVVAKMSLRF